MSDITQQPWFWPALIVVIGLPVLLLVLTELNAWLTRRGHPAAKVVRLVRNYLLPMGALLLLISQVTLTKQDFTWTKIAATVFGFLVILVLLNGLNVVLFSTAERGSWRERMPSIFVDLLRLLLIIVSLAVLFAWVWGADVGGLFTALGVSSIVIGLALQNAIGPIVSGLFLLFEQPFRLGDWLDTGSVRGRVIEVNWRAVHIDTGNGIQIVPNGSLADSSFTNLSKAPGPYSVSSTLTFATDDAPQDVIGLLRRVAGELPMVARGEAPSAYPIGGAKYEVNIPVSGPALEGQTLALFLTWLWYAARRAGLHLDGDLTDDYNTPERLLACLRLVAPTLHLASDELEDFLASARLERFGAGEVIQRTGTIPETTGVIALGTARLGAPVEGGGEIPLGLLGENEFVGLTALTREKLFTTIVASTDVTLVTVSVPVLEELVRKRPALAREIGQTIDNRRSMTEEAGGDVSETRGLGQR
ncbi:mechanosensitive ion channel domain-containing protein [Leifsonia poae]|uniref:mechanosensitive ion channel domain-containing protein n=1 Tax=Leifsonia poae TaxID=110933 RepID=UPI001CBF153F|nr:mechanosensitive ion channel family protein [Leifsonia poae]